MKKSPNMRVVPSAESRELALYSVNNGELYRRMLPALNNLARKYKKGVFDSNRAIDALYPFATEAAKMYSREFGNLCEWNVVFDVTARYSAAAEMVDFFMEDIENGGL